MTNAFNRNAVVDAENYLLQYNSGKYLVHVLPDHSENTMVEGPATLVNIVGITKSNLEKAPEFVNCIKYYYEINRHINPDASGGRRGSGSNDFTDLTILIPHEAYVATLMSNQQSGKILDTIVIRSIHWTGNDESFETYKEETFSHCQVIEIARSHTYWTAITFHIRKIDITVFKFNQSTGVKEGQNKTVFNYIEDQPNGDSGGSPAPAAAAPAKAPAPAPKPAATAPPPAPPPAAADDDDMPPPPG